MTLSIEPGPKTAQLDLFVNGEALATAGSALETGGDQIRRGLVERELELSQGR
ncbi:MAG: hypothetical protein H0T53_06090 [Herpetosiphonaceae bacterium]|nr:hypothetical protein [Herpetosiphonaceae bacterium]